MRTPDPTHEQSDQERRRLHPEPGDAYLLTLFGAEHTLGWVAGHPVTETTDETPERVAAIQRLAWAYLRTVLYPEETAWSAARAAFEDVAEPLGRIVFK